MDPVIVLAARYLPYCWCPKARSLMVPIFVRPEGFIERSVSRLISLLDTLSNCKFLGVAMATRLGVSHERSQAKISFDAWKCVRSGTELVCTNAGRIIDAGFCWCCGGFIMATFEWKPERLLSPLPLLPPAAPTDCPVLPWPMNELLYKKEILDTLALGRLPVSFEWAGDGCWEPGCEEMASPCNTDLGGEFDASLDMKSEFVLAL